MELVSLSSKYLRAVSLCALFAILCLAHGILIAQGAPSRVIPWFLVGFVVMFVLMGVGTVLLLKAMNIAEPAPEVFERRSPSFGDYSPVDRMSQVAGYLTTIYVFIQGAAELLGRRSRDLGWSRSSLCVDGRNHT